MSTTLVEQSLPLHILVVSRVPAYAHVLMSIIAILIITVCPSMASKLPVRVPLPEPPVRSLKSTASTSTLVDSNASDDKDSAANTADDARDPSSERVKFTNPFAKLASPVKAVMSPNLSLRPFARRMTLPARRFSAHITTAIVTPFHSHHHHIGDSYFTPAPSSPEAAIVEAEESGPEELVLQDNSNDELTVHTCANIERPAFITYSKMVIPETVHYPKPKGPGMFKRTMKKAKVIFRLRRQS